MISSGLVPTVPCPYLMSSRAGTALPVGSHKDRAEGHNHLPQPDAHRVFAVAQNMFGFLDCKSMLQGHVELHINKHPQVFPNRAALNPLSVQPVYVEIHDEVKRGRLEKQRHVYKLQALFEAVTEVTH